MIKFVSEITYGRYVLGDDHDPVHHLGMTGESADEGIGPFLLGDEEGDGTLLLGVNHTRMRE